MLCINTNNCVQRVPSFLSPAWGPHKRVQCKANQEKYLVLTRCNMRVVFFQTLRYMTNFGSITSRIRSNYLCHLQIKDKVSKTLTYLLMKDKSIGKLTLPFSIYISVQEVNLRLCTFGRQVKASSNYCFHMPPYKLLASAWPFIFVFIKTNVFNHILNRINSR